MVSDMVERIRNVEAQAAAIIEDAHRQKEQILKDAANTAKEMELRAEAKAKDDAAFLMQKEKEAGAHKLEAAKAQAATQAGLLKEVARKGQTRAVDKILESLI